MAKCRERAIGDPLARHQTNPFTRLVSQGSSHGRRHGRCRSRVGAGGSVHSPRPQRCRTAPPSKFRRPPASLREPLQGRPSPPSSGPPERCGLGFRRLSLVATPRKGRGSETPARKSAEGSAAARVDDEPPISPGALSSAGTFPPLPGSQPLARRGDHSGPRNYRPRRRRSGQRCPSANRTTSNADCQARCSRPGTAKVEGNRRTARGTGNISDREKRPTRRLSAQPKRTHIAPQGRSAPATRRRQTDSGNRAGRRSPAFHWRRHHRTVDEPVVRHYIAAPQSQRDRRARANQPAVEPGRKSPPGGGGRTGPLPSVSSGARPGTFPAWWTP